MARSKLSTEEQSQVEFYNQRAADNARQLFEALKERDPNMTQVKAAQICGWTQGNLNHYLTGKAPIGQVALKRLCKLFDCKPHDIREEYRDELREELMEIVSAGLELMSGAQHTGNDELDHWVHRAKQVMNREDTDQRCSA